MAPISSQNTEPFDSDLNTLVQAALAGGRAAMAIYQTDFVVERKADASPVSIADRAAEEAILAALAEAFPDIPVVAEESYAEGHVPEVAGRFFLVDPLDGTKEFIARNGEFTVNIALIEDRVPVLGVVLAPAIGRAYAGGGTKAFAGSVDAGCGEIADWRPIRVRDWPDAPVVVASRSHSNPETEEMIGRTAAQTRRSIGSSLKFCLVAEGEADFYPRIGSVMEWDTAAGDAVLRAAGGMVVTRDGKPLLYGKTDRPGVENFRNPDYFALGDLSVLTRLSLAEAA
ncbi:3'(2'), 5'-bisphosphate nucleotidase [Faunimonas pinastri]|uniref:3'(2'),5'-bisphosphate nucleotidase CysQ n=1 Tax=Faunimonas pinastri TaxID=1855383 RepID=A0A1H9HKX4_9HYPH|nr:3'(2'),5'-bisphosphate nucleotidase CysQ [Faunimonas pinastri]SEQ62973.1 3'(2'), 5'-bisphosphate nucleotidase [Faunimonas pinastri]